VRRLYRHFLRSFFLSDVLAEGSDPRAVGIAIAAIFAAPGAVICFQLALVYTAGVNVDPLRGYFVALSLLLAGLLALVQWEALLPTRLDYAILGPIPLPPGMIAGAKLLALAALLGGFIAILNVYSSILFPLFTTPDAAGFATVLRRIAAQLIAAAAAAAWAFLAVVGLRALLPSAGVIARGARLGLTVALLAAVVLCLDLTSPAVYFHLAAARPWWAWPVFWFVGLDKTLAGIATPADRAAGYTAAWMLAATAGVALAAYTLRSWHEARTPPRPVRAGRRWGAAWFAQYLTPQPRQRAVIGFATATLARSRRHGVYSAAWLAFGTAAALAWLTEALGARPGSAAAILTAALAAPLALGFGLIVGLRHVIAIPIELRANWLFRLAESEPAPERFFAARKILLTYGALPAAALAAAVGALAGGWRLAEAHLAFCAALLWLLVEVVQVRFEKLPFTCAYVAGRANLKTWWLAYWLAFVAFAYGAATIEAHLLLRGTIWTILPTAGSAAAAAALWRVNVGRQRALNASKFDDESQNAIQKLELIRE
jgi:hypothetical protein